MNLGISGEWGTTQITDYIIECLIYWQLEMGSEETHDKIQNQNFYDPNRYRKREADYYGNNKRIKKLFEIVFNC
ncbi:hypothetical protein JCM10550A_20650 [Methanogenium cariaci]